MSILKQWRLGIAACACTGLSAGPAPVDLRSGFVLVANQQDGTASLIDLSTDSSIAIPVGTGPHEAVISPSGRTGLVTIYGTQTPGNQLAVIDIAGARVIRTISLGQYTRPHGALFLPGDESRAVVTSEATQNLVLVNLAEGTVEGAIRTGAAGSHMVAVTADGKRAYTSDIGTGAVSAIDLGGKALLRVIPVAPRVEGIAVTPDGKTVWAGSNTNGTVSVIDPQSGAILATLGGFTLPYRLAISADGRIAIICDPQADKLTVADVAERKILWSLDSLGSPRGVNIAPDGKTAFVTLAADRTMGIIDLEQRKLVRRVRVGPSPDGVWYGPAPSAGGGGAQAALPARRAHHALEYDQGSQRVLLTGGSSPVDGGARFVFMSDLWAFDGIRWTPLPVVGASMSGMRLAYDSRHGRMLSFGGYDGAARGDLRGLGSGGWEDLGRHPEVVAAEPGFVYDGKANRLVLFGGSAGPGLANGDTWILSGGSWRKLAGPAPPARQAQVLVYDEQRDRTVLFGGMGSGPPGQPPPSLGDTWELEGERWVRRELTGPSARSGAGAAYDSKRGLLILFGGVGADGFQGDTWAYDGFAWRKLADTGPEPRGMGYLAYDRRRDRVVLFGGRKGWPDGDLNDTWEWDGTVWREVGR